VSKEGLGRLLMQEGRVIAYTLRKLQLHEENYATRDLELVVIVHAFRIWRHYLVGRKFELKTDHHGLQHIFTQCNLNVRQRIWPELLSEYDFEITYIKGTINKFGDALSRRLCIFSVIPLKKNLRENIIKLQLEDEWYKEVKSNLENEVM
jgi:hypothetical protein